VDRAAGNLAVAALLRGVILKIEDDFSLRRGAACPHGIQKDNRRNVRDGKH